LQGPLRPGAVIVLQDDDVAASERLMAVVCPFARRHSLAQSRHFTTEFQRPLSGVKRTSKFQGAKSAFDRKRRYGGAARLGVQLVVLRANSDRDFEGAFTTMIEQESCGAPGSACSLAARHNIPAAYELREFARPASLSIRAREPRALIGIGLGRGRYNGK